jgi:hypothetical protein
MEHSIQNETTTSHEDDWQPRPELLQAMHMIATITEGDDTAVITDRAITFNHLAQRTSIIASEVNLVAIDGQRISERIDIRTPLPEVFSEMTDEQIALANTLATTGAIVRDPDEGGTVLVSSLPVFEVDTVALKDLYTRMVANGALMQILGPIAAAQYMNEPRDDEPVYDTIPGWGSPSYWDESEFMYAEAMLRRAGVYCNAGKSGLTAEFAWDEGASSAMLGDCTSLMRFQTDMPHPVAGNGLFFKLDLPITLDREQLAECANYLNVYEAKGIDTPPFFGAWCSKLDNGTLSFAGFWPNCMYQKGTVVSIASWCRARSRIVRQAIGNR